MNKIIIVEGKTDKARLELILDEPVKILCSYGTLETEKLEEWIEKYQNDDIYILTDADEPGNKLRHQIQREIPNVHHLYTQKMYREVATTPLEYLSGILERAHFAVKELPPAIPPSPGAGDRPRETALPKPADFDGLRRR